MVFPSPHSVGDYHHVIGGLTRHENLDYREDNKGLESGGLHTNNLPWFPQWGLNKMSFIMHILKGKVCVLWDIEKWSWLLVSSDHRHPLCWLYTIHGSFHVEGFYLPVGSTPLMITCFHGISHEFWNHSEVPEKLMLAKLVANNIPC